MPCFLETDIRERVQTSVDNTVNNLHQSKTFLFFFKQNSMFFLLEKYILKNPKNSITLAFLFIYLFILSRQILKEKEMPWQKPLRPISNAWGNPKLPPFWENFRTLNLPLFIKKGMVSIMLQLFSIMPLRNYGCM